MSFRKTSVLVATAFLVAAPGTLAAALPKVPDASGHLANSQFQIKPASIQISGDGSFYFDGKKESHNHAAPLAWTSWTATGGRGSGFNWVNNCQPSCAQGKFHQYPVKLRVWRPEHVGGHLIFTRMTVTYTNGFPKGVPHKKDVFKVTHKKGGLFFWNYPS
ncbi:MAG TPA: hypothetical protein VE983_06155 [Solirubrobacteraceae bacterium]|nr:hypothetical protein [Solirubrobacteraceae bacterium]